MVTVELKMIPGEADAAKKFLISKLRNSVDVHGGRVEISEKKVVEVKMLLEKFLHREKLKGYRVLSQQGVVTVEPDNPDVPEESHHDKIKGVSPFPPFSQERLPLMDLVYPNYTSRGYGYKKKKKP